LQQGVEKVRGFWGKALLDALRRDGRACNGGGLRPIGVGGTGIAGGTAEHQVGEGTACEFALALDEACFACEGVGFMFEYLLEGVFDLCCKVGSVAHCVWSVPSSGAVLKLMLMGVPTEMTTQTDWGEEGRRGVRKIASTAWFRAILQGHGNRAHSQGHGNRAPT
jgi:hypothetical protein